MAALPPSAYRYKSRNVRMSRVTFPDPIQEAQVLFRTKPSDLMETHNAKETFLQSIADYKNMRSGIDYMNHANESSLKNILPFSGNEIEDKKRMDKLKDLFKNVTDSQQLGPALIQFLQTPEVKALIDKTKSGLQEAMDTKINDALQTFIGTPVRVPMSALIDKFKTADLGELPLFEISMDPAGPEKGLLGIFKELDSKSYFELLPVNDSEFKTSLNVVNDRQQHLEIPLTIEFCDLMTGNKITDNESAKNKFYDLYNHTIKEKVDNIFSQFKSGQAEGYPNITDKYAMEEYKIQAAEKITEWAKKSIKFRVWIAELQSGDIVSDATKFLQNIEAMETPRRNLRSDTKKEKIKLSPEGKKTLSDAITRNPNKTRKQVKQELINMATEDESKFGYLIIKQGEGIIKTVVIPPSKLARLDRVKVILGNIEADNTADYLDEYSAIADALLKDKMITKDQHNFLVNKYTTLLNL
jgi:hypothetical protein